MGYKQEFESSFSVRKEFNEIEAWCAKTIRNFNKRFNLSEDEDTAYFNDSSREVELDLIDLVHQHGNTEIFIDLFVEFKDKLKVFLKDIDSYFEKEFTDYYEIKSGTNQEAVVNEKYVEFRERNIEWFEGFYYRIIAIEKNYIMLNTDSGLTFAENSFEAIRLSETCQINEIPTIFYNLLKNHKIKSSKLNIIRALISIFRDKDGNKLKESTLKDIFNDSKPHARSKKVN